MPREDARPVGQAHQLRVQRVILGTSVRSEARAADLADEQRVSREEAVIHQDAHRVGGMARRMEDPCGILAEGETCSIADGLPGGGLRVPEQEGLQAGERLDCLITVRVVDGRTRIRWRHCTQCRARFLTTEVVWRWLPDQPERPADRTSPAAQSGLATSP